MINDFSLLYGNPKKILVGINRAKTIFDPLCKGYWDPTSNIPALATNVGNNGEYYIVSISGSIDFGQELIEFEKEDIVTYNATTGFWTKK